MNFWMNWTMKTLIYNIVIFLLASIFAFSQPLKMHERMLTLKKVKLLEYMDLNESKSDKLLIIVTKYENELRDLNEKIKSLSKKLGEDLEKLSENELKKRNDELYSNLEKISNIQKDKLNEARSLLSEKEFAKFQMFELKFAHELRKHLFENRKKRKNE
jgi:hypothetical protein